MTDYLVMAARLNFRTSPRTGDVIAVLPRGHVVTGAPVKNDPEWLAVSALMPQGIEVRAGFVAATFVQQEGLAPKPGGTSAVSGPDFAAMRKFSSSGKDVILQGIVDELPTTGATFGLLDSKLVLCHFLAQACHESAYFRTTREYWGPTKAQNGYEGRADLGNVKAGDGKRYMGRGIFQLTGRANYRAMGKKLGLDLEGSPELAADPPVSFKIACQYWASRDIGKHAAKNDIVKVTKLINGGNNGLPDREALFARAMKIF
jgi:putative chitinase